MFTADTEVLRISNDDTASDFDAEIIVRLNELAKWSSILIILEVSSGWINKVVASQTRLGNKFQI